MVYPRVLATQSAQWYKKSHSLLGLNNQNAFLTVVETGKLTVKGA